MTYDINTNMQEEFFFAQAIFMISLKFGILALDQWFLNFHINLNTREGLLNYQLLRPTLRVSDSAGLKSEWELHANDFLGLGDADVAVRSFR